MRMCAQLNVYDSCSNIKIAVPKKQEEKKRLKSAFKVVAHIFIAIFPILLLLTLLLFFMNKMQSINL